MLDTEGVIRKTLAAVGLAALVLAAGPVAAQQGPAQGQSAASGGAPSAPKGPFAENFTFSNPPVPAPSAEFQALHGDGVSLADFRGRVVLVNFWATWCAPCVQEMPSLERLHTAVADEGFSVLAVSQDRGRSSVVAPFLARMDLQQLHDLIRATSAVAYAILERPRLGSQLVHEVRSDGGQCTRSQSQRASDERGANSQ